MARLTLRFQLPIMLARARLIRDHLVAYSRIFSATLDNINIRSYVQYLSRNHAEPKPQNNKCRSGCADSAPGAPPYHYCIDRHWHICHPTAVLFRLSPYCIFPFPYSVYPFPFCIHLFLNLSTQLSTARSGLQMCRARLAKHFRLTETSGGQMAKKKFLPATKLPRVYRLASY